MSGRKPADSTMTHALNRSLRLRDILKRWPLLLMAMLIAVGSAVWAHAHHIPSYTSKTTLMINPLAQWDSTFLGMDLVRDAGDPSRTAPTVAAELMSDHYASVAAQYLGEGWTPGAVAAAVKVVAPGNSNIVDITAHSTDPDKAKKIASGFAAAVIAERWQVISAQLESRIVALQRNSLTVAGDQQGVNPAATEQAARLQTLALVRDSRTDPTLSIGATSPAVAESQMSLPVLLFLATIGGLFVGALAAAALELVRRRSAQPSRYGRPFAASAVRAHVNGSSHVDAKSS